MRTSITVGVQLAVCVLCCIFVNNGAAMEADEREIRSAFERLDGNNYAHKLSYDVVFGELNRRGLVFGGDSTRALEKYDGNKDGYLNEEEFVGLILQRIEFINQVANKVK